MRKNKKAHKRFYNLIQNPYIIITFLTIIFLSAFLLRLAAKETQLPSIHSAAIFSIAIVFLVLAYSLMKKKEKRQILLWIFLISLAFELLIFLAMPLDTSKWKDARGYHNLAIYTTEKGPLYLIENYHRLVGWNSSFCPDSEERLDKLITNKDLLALVKDKLRVHDMIDLSDYNFTDYSADRPGSHPPGWTLTMYLFVLFFGSSEIVVILAEFALASILCSVVYWFLRKHTDFKTALFLSFLFILTPGFVFYSSMPLADVPISIYIIVSIYFFSELMKSNKTSHLLIASIFFSIALFTKFVLLFFYLLFLIITLIKKGRMKHFILFSVISMAPIILLSIFGYYYFLNAVSSMVFASCAPDLAGAPGWLYFITHLPKEVLVLFSIPVLYMISISTLDILRKKRGVQEKIMLAYLLCFFVFGIVLAMSVSRLLFMFSPLLLMLAIGPAKKNLSPRFTYFCIAISSIHLFIFLILNILNL